MAGAATRWPSRAVHPEPSRFQPREVQGRAAHQPLSRDGAHVHGDAEASGQLLPSDGLLRPDVPARGITPDPGKLADDPREAPCAAAVDPAPSRSDSTGWNI